MFFKDPKNKLTAGILCFLSALCFAFVPWAIKSITLELTLVSLLLIIGVRSFATALVQFFLIGPSKFNLIPETKTEIGVIICRSLVSLGWIGALATVMPSATAVLIFFCYPFFTTIFASIGGKKLRRIDLISLALGIMGLSICVMYEVKAGSIYGSLMVFGASIANGLLFVLTDYIKDERKSNVFALAEVLCSLFAICFFVCPQTPDLTSFTAMLIAGVLAGLAMHFLAKSMYVLVSHEASLIMLIQPILTIIIGIVFLGERILPVFYLGSALIFVACYIKFR